MTPDVAAVLTGDARWAVVDAWDSLALLAALPTASVDALITDPPYSSGGAFRGDRTGSTDAKYTQSQHQGARPDFAGDTRDQRAFAYWTALWLAEATRVVKPGGPAVLFIDWRQLPSMTDALQAGGWVWRGIAVWDKTEGVRPQMGSFRSQCEYLVWGTNGARDDAAAAAVGVLPGVFRVPVRADDKHHQTGKPTALMQEVVRIAPPGGVILDPFAGSGTTGVAALLTGRRAILCERVAEYSGIARARCGAADSGTDWRAPSQLSLLAGGTR